MRAVAKSPVVIVTLAPRASSIDQFISLLPVRLERDTLTNVLTVAPASRASFFITVLLPLRLWTVYLLRLLRSWLNSCRSLANISFAKKIGFALLLCTCFVYIDRNKNTTWNVYLRRVLRTSINFILVTTVTLFCIYVCENLICGHFVMHVCIMGQSSLCCCSILYHNPSTVNSPLKLKNVFRYIKV